MFSQHVQALRGLHTDEEKIDAIGGWQISDVYSRAERAVLAYSDAIALDHGRVSDDVFAVIREELSDEAVFELTYISGMYLQHAVVTRALRLEYDDVPERVAEVRPPEEFDAEHYVAVGSEKDAKERLRRARG